MILSKQSLLTAIHDGDISISPFASENLKEASYTFTLAATIKRIKPVAVLDLRDVTAYDEIIMDEKGYVLEPGGFAVGYTTEHLSLHGKYACTVSTRGTIAQKGFASLLTDTFCEPDTDNTIALAMHNASGMPVLLTPGLKILKGVFTKVV
jgi:deoxycytidine triphosphate deaminase